MDGNTSSRLTSKSKIVFAIEDFTSSYEESERLIGAHFAEVEEQDKDLDPDWESYISLSSTGFLKAMSIRCDGQLVGYCLVIKAPSLHLKGSVASSVDVLYIEEEFRRFDVATRFITFIEKVMEQNGVDYLCFGVRPKRDYSALLKRKGYTHRETVYRKELNNG